MVIRRRPAEAAIIRRRPVAIVARRRPVAAARRRPVEAACRQLEAATVVARNLDEATVATAERRQFGAVALDTWKSIED